MSMSDRVPVPRSRNAAIGLGILIALAGVVLLVWPAATTLVLVSWLGLAIVVYGVHEVINAITGGGGRSRVWSGVIGAVAIIGGLSIFMTPIVGSITIGLVIGWYWLIGGVVGIVGTIVEPGNRLVRGFVAAISVFAGLAVLAQPRLSLVALAWFAGVWALVSGLMMVGSALFGTRRQRTFAGN